jgi:hypothetical protein
MTTTSDTDTVLVMRCCAPDGSSRNGFRWPRSGPVEAPDWRDDSECGGGLHGWLWGEGDPSVGERTGHDDLWLIVEVRADAVRNLGGKVKFPRGVVVAAGNRAEITTEMARRAPGRRVLWVTLTGGDRSTLTGGYRSTLTGGDDSTLTGGDDSALCGWWSDGRRRRLAVAYVGEAGIEPGRAYRCEAGRWVEVAR